MKKLHLIAIAALAPTQVLAHGAHAPLAGPAHDAAHAGPLVAVGLIAVAGILALKRR